MKVLVDYNKKRKLTVNDYDFYGSRGFCLVRNDKIRKIYFMPKNDKQMTDFSIYQSDHIAFPTNYLYDISLNDQVVGEDMPYFKKDGIIRAIDYDSNLDLLIEHYKKIVGEIKKFPEIMMNDLCSPNILYNEESGFSLIDTSEWRCFDVCNFVRDNIRKLDFELTSLLLEDLLDITPMTVDGYTFFRNIKKMGRKGNILLNLLYATFNEETFPFIEFIELYRWLLQKYSGEFIKTIDDMEIYTKKLKKG